MVSVVVFVVVYRGFWGRVCGEWFVRGGGGFCSGGEGFVKWKAIVRWEFVVFMVVWCDGLWREGKI